MKLYAEYGPRLAAQVVADAAAVCWSIGVVAFASAGRDLVLGLQAPAAGLAQGGTTIAEAFDTAAGTAELVPFIGGPLAGALRGGQTAGLSLSSLGQQQYETVGSVASGTTLVLAVLGALPLLLGWLPLRAGYARAAGSAVECREHGLDLLALRALNRQPVQRLRTVSEDPAGAWRGGDPAVLGRLAALELARLGLRAPDHPAR